MLLGLATGCGHSGPVSREPLDAAWNETMLTGVRAIIANGRRLDVPSSVPLESVGGNPFFASTGERGISVCDYRETRLLGLWRNGGWCLGGGLLQRVEDPPDVLELYAKLVRRMYPYFPLPIHRDTREDWGFEFFLLHRSPAAPRAAVLARWVFRPEEAPPGPGGGSPFVHGYLEYDPRAEMATVAITGLRRPFAQRVDVSAVVRD